MKSTKYTKKRWTDSSLYQTNISILKIFTSPKHNYFTRDKFDIGDAPTIEHKNVILEKNKGLAGDRFEFSKYPITFLSLEVVQDLCENLDIELNLQVFRRNIIISGVHLNSLIGKRFKIADIQFEGIAHCAPCTWMNAVMKKGAYIQMRGRGGLRAKVIKGGELKLGQSIFLSEEELGKDMLEALTRPNIP